MDIFLTLLYATLIGFYNIFKKFALKRSRESVILVLFTSVTFLLSLAWIPFGISIPWQYILVFMLKGFLLALSWFLILKILKDADLSVATVTQIISSILSFILGIVIFHETAGIWQILGSIIIVLGVAGINLCNRNSKGKITKTHLIFLLVSSLITTSSNIIDKITTSHLSQYQIQFWFLLFVCIFSWIFFGIECIRKKEFLIKTSDIKNYWIYLVGLFLFVGDFLLMSAYKVPGSQMITISILSKLTIVITVLAGIFIFKEKNPWKKIILSLVVILGAVMISVL